MLVDVCRTSRKSRKHPDMIDHAKHLLVIEKAWLTSQIGLIPDHDDDVMDEQKWSSCSWLLLREFVKIHREAEERLRVEIDADRKTEEALLDLPLPRLSYYKCRQIMTRTDFLDDLDHASIIAMDINHDVNPDSELLLRAAREVVEEEDFDEQLDSVRDRVDKIESLHKTRELTFKDVNTSDRIQLAVDKGGPLLIEDGSSRTTTLGTTSSHSLMYSPSLARGSRYLSISVLDNSIAYTAPANLVPAISGPPPR
ncbi:hypothetical protein BDW22DRAFT_1428263 [Trametopsis cervina]|nr:hypothetical protein BDW22DRAFT_1428263 [Trametopsis cervina]